MKRTILENYPDYLREFKEIQTIANVQQQLIDIFMGDIRDMLSEIYLDSVSETKWNDMVNDYSSIDRSIAVKRYLQRHYVLTLSVMKSILTCWFEERRFDLSYDRETMTFTFRTTLEEPNFDKWKVRAAIPCNMDVKYEFVDEL
ncbi:MAG: hypothetical protein ACI3XA_09865 [Clostridia bacterium]